MAYISLINNEDTNNFNLIPHRQKKNPSKIAGNNQNDYKNQINPLYNTRKYQTWKKKKKKEEEKVSIIKTCNTLPNQMKTTNFIVLLFKVLFS